MPQVKHRSTMLVSDTFWLVEFNVWRESCTVAPRDQSLPLLPYYSVALSKRGGPDYLGADSSTWRAKVIARCERNRQQKKLHAYAITCDVIELCLEPDELKKTLA